MNPPRDASRLGAALVPLGSLGCVLGAGARVARWGLPAWALGADLQRAGAVITAAAGVPPGWLRAPVGLISPRVGEAGRRVNLSLCHWTSTAADGTRHRSAEAGLRRLQAGLRPGAILA